MLPPAIEAFTNLPFWNTLFLLMALAVAVYFGSSLRRTGRRQDLYYTLLGAYLAVVQLPEVFPDAFRLLGITTPALDSPPGLVLALPAVALFILGVRAGGEPERTGEAEDEMPRRPMSRHDLEDRKRRETTPRSQKRGPRK